MSDNWQRVTREEPCGICGKPDWCCRGELGFNCMRVESAKPVANGGWFHFFKGGDAICRSRKTYSQMPVSVAAATSDPFAAAKMTALLEQWRSSTNGQLGRLSFDLGVTEESLRDLGAAWAGPHHAFAFPMCNGQGDVTGIRLRSQDGYKWAVKGTKAGAFFPAGALGRLPTNRVFITEGPTDTAAALSLGLFAIGRPSCLGCEAIVASLVNQIGCKEVVIIFDTDAVGVRGAEKLAASLPRIRVARFVPPAKDFRAYAAAGGTAQLVNAAINDCLWSKV